MLYDVTSRLWVFNNFVNITSFLPLFWSLDSYLGVSVAIDIDFWRLIINCYLWLCQRLTIPSSFTEKFRHLLNKCWDGKPDQRPSFKEILLFLENMETDGMGFVMF